MDQKLANSSRPIIVIGAARSGTKFLRDLIGASAHCQVVPYDVNYIWRLKNEKLSHDALTAEDCTPAIAERIRKRLYAAAGHDAAKNVSPSFLVEKTVSNCLRIPFIEQVFPDAVYVNLVRDGRNVVESSVRMWRAPVNYSHLIQKARQFPLSNLSYAVWYLKNIIGAAFTRGQGVRIWGVRYPAIEHDIEKLSVPEICAKQWRLCVEKSMNDLKNIPSSRVIEVRYEALTREESEVQRICDFLQLPDDARVLEHYRQKNRPPKITGWRPAFVGKDWEAAMGILLPTLHSLGYDEAS